MNIFVFIKFQDGIWSSAIIEMQFDLPGLRSTWTLMLEYTIIENKIPSTGWHPPNHPHSYAPDAQTMSQFATPYHIYHTLNTSKDSTLTNPHFAVLFFNDTPHYCSISHWSNVSFLIWLWRQEGIRITCPRDRQLPDGLVGFSWKWNCTVTRG